MTTLFLDFDGTLHAWPILRPFEHAGALAAALAPFDVKIILTTSWVLKDGWVIASRRLPPALTERVTGSVYEGLIDTSRSRLNRAEIIQRYLALPRWPRISRWVVLDDAACAFEEEERVIRCDATTGLTASDLNRLARMLRKLAR